MVFEEKYLHVLPAISVAGRSLKRYHVTNDAAAMPADIEGAAHDMLPQLLPPPDDETPAAAFMVLHRGRDGAAYLNTYSWVWSNVIHAAHAVSAQPFLDSPDDDPTHFRPLDRPWIGCIWELPPLAHERSAWVRHIYGADTPDLDAYLADSLPGGRTGGP